MKRWRVTQYQQLSDLGLALWHTPARLNTPQKTVHKDFRWLWRAKLCAWANRGLSAGLGLRLFTTEITDLLDTEPEA